MSNTAVAEAPEVKKAPAVYNADALVREQFPEKDGYKLRICPLWTNSEGVSFYRVNYLSWEDWKRMECYWVVVNKGVVKAEKEIPSPKKS